MATVTQRWQEQAECRGIWTEIFFPDQSTPGSIFDPYREAKTFCDRCPVATECLEDAFNTETRDGQRHGMRGGLTPAQRKTLARSKDRQYHRTKQHADAP